MQPRVVNLDGLAPEARAHLLSGLPHAFGANRSRARGIGIAIVFMLITLGACAFHASGIKHDWRPRLYAPVTFGWFAFLVYLSVMPLVAWWRMRRSLARQPHQGVFLTGANLVVATEHMLTVLPFAQCQIQRVGPVVNFTSNGLLHSFTFVDGRAFQVESEAKNNANALAHAAHYGDQATMMRLDPFAYVPPLPAPHKPLASWIVALPAIALALPLMYGLEVMTDNSWYANLASYQEENYLISHGHHVEELREKLCLRLIDAATTPPALRSVLDKPKDDYSYRSKLECADFKPKVDEKLENIYAKTRAELESQPAKARPVLIELLDASKKDTVTAKFVVHSPTQTDLKAIDTLVRNAKLRDIVGLADSFDPASLEKRAEQIRASVVTAINTLGPSETFRVVEDNKAESPGLTITLTYTLAPMVKGNDVIVYRETGTYAYASQQRFLGLTTHIELEIKGKSGAKYSVTVDADPAMSVSHGTGDTNQGIYNALADSALADLNTQLKTKLFPGVSTAPGKKP